MNNFIGNNIKFIVEWGQMTKIGFLLLLLYLIYRVVRCNKYYLPKGIINSLAFGLLLTLIIFSGLVFAWITRMKPSVIPILAKIESMVVNEAPQMEYLSVSDSLQQSITKQKGKILLVNYWATWCGPCVQEIPHLVAIQNQFENEGVKVIMISNEDQARLKRFMESRKIVLEVGTTNSFTWVDLGNERPASFLIDRDDFVVSYNTGGKNFDFFANEIKKIL